MQSFIIPWRCLPDDEPQPDHSKSNPKSIPYKPNPTPLGETSLNCPSKSSQMGNKKSADINNKTSQTLQTQPKTFAQVLSNLSVYCDIPSSQLPKPVLKGDNFSISIPEEEYEAGVMSCKLNLQARIIWPKGSSPLSIYDLRNKLSSLWRNLGKWGISSLGKGYYELTFSSLEDVKKVRSVPS